MLRSLATGDLAGKIRLQIYDRTAKAIRNGNTNTQLNRKRVMAKELKTTNWDCSDLQSLN